eukprot:CAMPEP_0172593216 /NCGR_PEP_ID=MMETSP1068-20121228/12400_1 /TAXON_ID=35684 /ORGANISM="Pseudopedinella elastica, Strain CCMP716" /LENGTH=176 /DNA_ID=CAMNT_0013390637 /DNA_START=113 /DNA_END=639 /DNA_ORIENTATION=+
MSGPGVIARRRPSLLNESSLHRSTSPAPPSRFGGLAARNGEELANERHKELHYLFPTILHDNDDDLYNPKTSPTKESNGEESKSEEQGTDTDRGRQTLGQPPTFPCANPQSETPHEHQSPRDALEDRRRSSAARFRRDDKPRWDILHPHSKKRYYWDMLTLCFMVWVVIEVPFMYA